MKTLETYQQKLIEDHYYVAEQLAKKRVRNAPMRVRYDELLSSAFYGLVEAARLYKAEKGSFKTFAAHYIEGWMTQDIRGNDGGYRSGWEWRPIVMSSLDQSIENGFDVANETEQEEGLFKTIVQPICPLGRLIMNLYFRDDLTLKEMADRLGVEESRVSQMLGQYKKELKDHWIGREDELYQRR